ncbi:RNA methyltransferase [bacterium (Candidatus Blackallbacteria) CG17_big_fil_post_rev_8_21_14_2_50_48_46]|uniref:RNA methyltransferase n=1 Tax=bacterium (Candidatus Blackallbacteria) CG17_big_fil_post_rev_8_21_14_2_50_48_46 TaxID=2014261 RepID=A0A2M7G0C0_9BACT|nr:MAG: RNA methyltransferase [bacterium (Candidatus Blackallbacteria) CG18_big_fil_WC_8_21_14_2_50_49_26]PIW15168.1 MAG: RNA methyltransferase [bacterium (Candidatus Blackallbacteria) CG17_big_fil_post_rev_8_21_14_2_50_48_46]PIW50155.1 MAG: RNA methyltransferase [bacterium (Candidatus Blackallbacteria) CG13_big_fil_rev_8_21_14_2_50_49_14]
MAFDPGLAERLRTLFQDLPETQEKKMFGGLCFLVSKHMCCGIVGEKLMARVGPEQYEACLKKAHVLPMDFTGKPMKGMVYILPEGFAEDQTLSEWVEICLQFVHSLPPK